MSPRETEMKKKIERLGGEFPWQCKVSDPSILEQTPLSSSSDENDKVTRRQWCRGWLIPETVNKKIALLIQGSLIMQD